MRNMSDRFEIRSSCLPSTSQLNTAPIPGIGDILIGWVKITFSAPPQHIDDDAVRNRGAVHRLRHPTACSPRLPHHLLPPETQVSSSRNREYRTSPSHTEPTCITTSRKSPQKHQKQPEMCRNASLAFSTFSNVPTNPITSKTLASKECRQFSSYLSTPHAIKELVTDANFDSMKKASTFKQWITLMSLW
jgi:hypothetical protein